MLVEPYSPESLKSIERWRCVENSFQGTWRWKYELGKSFGDNSKEGLCVHKLLTDRKNSLDVFYSSSIFNPAFPVILRCIVNLSQWVRCPVYLIACSQIAHNIAKAFFQHQYISDILFYNKDAFTKQKLSESIEFCHKKSASSTQLLYIILIWQRTHLIGQLKFSPVYVWRSGFSIILKTAINNFTST